MKVERSLGRIEEKLESVATDAADTKTYVRAISDRVRSLEISRGWLLGASAFVAATISWVLGFF
jgi:hypothetical protein